MTPEEVIKYIIRHCNPDYPKGKTEWETAMNMAIEALKAQSKHSQNTMQNQPDLDTLGIKIGETCADTISRQAAIDVVRRCSVKEVTPAYMLIDKAEVMTELMMLPSAQPEPTLEQIEEYCHKRCLSIVDNALLHKYAQAEIQQERKKGEWIDKSGGIEGAWNYCSVCGEQAIDLYDFCPNCGADMRGETDG